MSISEQLPKACVILGAGASYDCYNGTSPLPSGLAWQPPLARDLFLIGGHHDNYWEILQHYEGAQVIASRLQPYLDNNGFDLEGELRKYAFHDSENLSNAYKHVPPYLRDLIWAAAKRYTQVPGCYLNLASQLLDEEPRHQVLFLTLNYDDLLEVALTKLDPSLTFRGIYDYISARRKAQVVKLHGSIDWFFTFPRHSAKGWKTLAYELEIAQKRLEGDIIIKQVNDVPFTSVRHSDRWLYPVLTAPLAGKTPDNFVCPQSHTEFARNFLKDCRKFLVIGASGRDSDLLSLLDSAVPRGLPIQLDVVSSTDAEDVFRRFREGVSAFPSLGSNQLRLSNQGFREYVGSDSVKQFRFGTDLAKGRPKAKSRMILSKGY